MRLNEFVGKMMGFPPFFARITGFYTRSYIHISPPRRQIFTNTPVPSRIHGQGPSCTV